MTATYNLEEVRLSFLREERDRLLQESDKYILADFPLSDEKKEEWIQYRQALRDFPENGTNITNDEGAIIGFNWPNKPSSIE